MSSTTETPPTDPAVVDELFDAMSHPYRRRILTHLSDRDPPDEGGVDPQALANADDPDSWDIEVFHNHLPKLDDAGFVDWDRENGVVRQGPQFGEIAPVVARLVNHEDELPAGWT